MMPIYQAAKTITERVLKFEMAARENPRVILEMPKSVFTFNRDMKTVEDVRRHFAEWLELLVMPIFDFIRYADLDSEYVKDSEKWFTEMLAHFENEITESLPGLYEIKVDAKVKYLDPRYKDALMAIELISPDRRLEYADPYDNDDDGGVFSFLATKDNMDAFAANGADALYYWDRNKKTKNFARSDIIRDLRNTRMVDLPHRLFKSTSKSRRNPVEYLGFKHIT